jgi:hypothetical protein
MRFQVVFASRGFGGLRSAAAIQDACLDEAPSRALNRLIRPE